MLNPEFSLSKREKNLENEILVAYSLDTLKVYPIWRANASGYVFQDVAIGADEADPMYVNSAAVIKFVQFLSYYFRIDETVLSLARADSWIIAFAVLLTPLDGNGGKLNKKFKGTFRTL